MVQYVKDRMPTKEIWQQLSVTAVWVHETKESVELVRSGVSFSVRA
jgi:hypothetical protein